MDLANWTLRTSPKFDTGVKYQYHQGFDHFRDPEIPFILRPPFTIYIGPTLLYKWLKILQVIYEGFDCNLTQGFLK